ncbi:MAG: DNA polymerase III subunit delta [Candidatus Dormibacteraeota bacterium]|uniref:DNA-directed DNA polymerase n=1 Tax=Candidatus Aeolococcus gillhamiae TaxID=3127015 RepID=A0A934JT89_9BACT|nr:DNA polymerase III subunit delta [Candidatus Dormibacteraeota bacterium]
MSDGPGLLLVHGDEPHLVDATVARWRAAVHADDIEVIDAPARLEPLIASLVDVPLFASERHVLVRDLPQLSGARRGTAGVDELIRALAMRSRTTQVCFAIRATVAAGNPILAAIQASGGQVVHHQKLRPSERRQWLDTEVRSRGLRLPPGGTDLLLRCTAGDLGAIGGELDKIAAHGERISTEQLERLVAGTEQLELYRVLDLLAGPQPAAGAALLTDLIAEGRSTQYLLSILAGQIRDLLMVHALLLRGPRGTAALASAMRIPAWRAERVVRTAQAIPAVLATRWMHELQRIDAGMKAGEIDDAAALRHWGLAAAGSLAERRERRTA